MLSRFHTRSNTAFGVAEAEDGQVLHRLLAEVVVDAEDALLGEDGVQGLVEPLRRGEVVAEGLLDDHHRTPRQPAAVEVADQRDERRRRHGEVDDAGLLGEPPCERLHAVGGVDVEEPLREAGEDVLVEPGAGVRGDRVARVGAEVLVAPGLGGVSDDGATRRQQVLGLEVVERRDQLAGGEVAGGSDDDDVLGVGPAQRHRRRRPIAAGRAARSRRAP